MNREQSRRAEILAHLRKHGAVSYEHMAEQLPGDFRGLVHQMADEGLLDRDKDKFRLRKK